MRECGKERESFRVVKYVLLAIFRAQRDKKITAKKQNLI